MVASNTFANRSYLLPMSDKLLPFSYGTRTFQNAAEQRLATGVDGSALF